MTGTELKTLYEKYCYLNKYTELKLSDEENQKYLIQKNFELRVKDDCFTEVYTKVIIKDIIEV